ncbi:MAG: DEAD/DEAH box helicase [Candidatus Hermodarchaeota archaeon]|nr:DEAD/DEAH box helicase [Candidatus Hermodarchaeota archaeon]
MSKTEFVQHPLIKPNSITKRLYQETIIGSAVKWNTLTVLPTGVGKTVIAILAAAYQLRKYPNSKCVILAPTKPLVLQHHQTFQDFMQVPSEKMKIITGEVNPTKREELWNQSQIAFMTPQVLQNDLLTSRYGMENLSLLVVDEAHRAVGEYAYVFIASQYLKTAKPTLLLALTASPSSEIDKIREIVNNLGIENIELRTRDSPDVAPYLPPVNFEWQEIQLPEKFHYVGQTLRRAIKTRLVPIKEADFINTSDPRRVSVRQILQIQREIQHQIATNTSPPSHLFQLVSYCAGLLRLYHCVELLETQGVTALSRYLQGLQKDARRSRASKAIQRLAQDSNLQEAEQLIDELISAGIEHPKLATIVEIVEQQLASVPSSRIMIFTRFRDMAKLLEKTLATSTSSKPIRFVGQASKGDDRGLTQKEQGEILQRFRNGTYNVLVATSVGEEGLDIQECDLVVFYEAVPSAIRLIQRRGRTGRTHPGRVIVLVALGTRDQGYYWAAIHRETKMKELLKEMNKMSRDIEKERKQSSLKEFMEPKTPEKPAKTENQVKIVVDNRELRSSITKALKELEVQLEVETLEVGDYILSDRVAVEAKTSDDFAQSIIDRRLFTQLSTLKENFAIPLLLITGASLYGSSAINPAAVRGALSSSIVDFNVPVVNVKDPKEAAALLFTIARREQTEYKRPIGLRGKKPVLSMAALQEYIVASLPGVNTTLSKRLLTQFGNISALIQASAEELAEVHGIGKAKAQKIREALDTTYEPEE